MSDPIQNDSLGLLSRLGQWFKPSPASEIFEASVDPSIKHSRTKSDDLDRRSRRLRKARVDLIRKVEFSELRAVINHVMTSVEAHHAASSIQVNSQVQSRAQQSQVRVQTREKIDTIEEQMSKSWYASSLHSGTGMPLTAGSRVSVAPPPAGDSQRVMRVHVGDQLEDFAYPPDAVNAAIAFALGDFISAERILVGICTRRDRTDRLLTSWHLRFEFYLSVNKRAEFEDASVDFAGKFGTSPPVWLGAWCAPTELHGSESGDASVTLGRPLSPAGTPIPTHLDLIGVRRLLQEFSRANTKGILRLNWTPLQSIEPHAMEALLLMFGNFASWTGRLEFTGLFQLKQLLATLARQTSDKTMQRTYWLLLLQCIRLKGDETAFEEASIEYCLSQEESAPPWIAPQCQFEALPDPLQDATPTAKAHFEATRPFVESDSSSAAGKIQVDLQTRTVTLKDVLRGDIQSKIAEMPLPKASQALVIDCSGLVRIDALAAGHLLSFLRQPKAQQGEVQLRHIHRLVGIYLFSLGLPPNVVLSLMPI